MQVAIHLGAHCTDDDALLKTLLQNRGSLAHEGICVPGPGRYRKTVLREAQKLRGVPADADFRDLLIGSIVDDDSAKRIVLSSENFLCVPSRIFENGLLYDQAGTRPKCLRDLFPGYEVEFFLAVRNPATFIPSAFKQKSQFVADFATFLDGVDVEQIRWSDVILAIRDTNPDSKITVWCNEDTPLIWPQVIKEISTHGPRRLIQGGNNILNQIMENEGLDRMATYLQSHPPRNEAQRRRVLLEFLDKYAIEDAVEEELDVPGWTDDLVQDLTDNYEADLQVIKTTNGVNLIAP
jgi:hypothetical protein